MREGRGWGEGGGWASWGGVIVTAAAAAACRGQWPAVRLIAVACRGGGGGTRQGTVRVARDGAGDVSLSLSAMGHVTL